MKKVYIKTFGCQMNEYDTDKMHDVLRDKNGYTKTDDINDADVVLLNTCSIREKAQEKVFSDLGRIRKLKAKNPNLIIGVGGCVGIGGHVGIVDERDDAGDRVRSGRVVAGRIGATGVRTGGGQLEGLQRPAHHHGRDRVAEQVGARALPEQVDEGRRILLFSQFTSMLALIEAELERAGLDYVILTGDTKDRETPVRRFQAGEVPIFLISLKAGGVGLNLTAADTVIHYDPWWNPAVENQATDRAHRLGQDKPVFVYKLIVGGSIEEKILALQERKAELAAGILSEDRGVDVKFGTDDLAALFEPLPV